MKENSNNQKSVWKLPLFLIISLLIFLLVLILILFLVLSLFFFYKKNEIKPPHNYKFTEINLFRNSTRRGFVTLPKTLKKEEFVSFFNQQTDSTFIITNFGGSKYSCTGSCFCSSENLRSDTNRRFASVLNRGLAVLFTAFSIPMAYRLAKETFEQQCGNKYGDICDQQHILSEIDSCKLEKTADGFYRVLEDKDDPENITEGAKYLCEGNCIAGEELDGDDFEDDMPEIVIEEFLSIREERMQHCEDMKLQKGIRVKIDFVAPQLYPVLQFIYHHLDEFCEVASVLQAEGFSKESREAFDKFNEKEELEFRNFQEWLYPRPACTGSLSEDDAAHQMNAECQELENDSDLVV